MPEPKRPWEEESLDSKGRINAARRGHPGMEAREFLVSQLTHPKPAMKLRAIKALSEWGDFGPDLLAMAVAEQDTDVREHIIEAFDAKGLSEWVPGLLDLADVEGLDPELSEKALDAARRIYEREKLEIPPALRKRMR